MSKDLELMKTIIAECVKRGFFSDAESVENTLNAFRRIALQVGEYEQMMQKTPGT